MAIEFDCPACEATIRVKDEAAGKKGRCPKCRALLLIPELGPDEDEQVEDELTVLPESTTPPPAPIPGPQGITASPREETIADQSTTPDPVSLADIQIQANVIDPPGTARLAPSQRSSRRARRRPIATSKLVSLAAALLGLAAVVGGGWYLYSQSRPDLTGALLGERLQSVNLATVNVSPPAEDVPIEMVESVLADLRRSELPLKSEYVVVVLAANEKEMTVNISPGPRSVAVRVSLRDHAGVQAVIKEKRDEIAKLKQAELKTAMAGFIRDFAAFLDGGPPMTKLPEYRNQVALNSSVGTVGYGIEAVVGQTPFPCVYEDAEGGCYFFPPETTTSFRIRGRKLRNGATPLPVEFVVQVTDARELSSNEATVTEESPEAAPKPDPQADPMSPSETDQEEESEESPMVTSPE